jgi:hypothetical protein
LSDTANENASAFGKYKIECIILKEGIDEHVFRRVNKFPFSIKHDKKKYEITAESLFEIEVSKYVFFRNLLFGIRREYEVIFREGEPQPIIRMDSAISPRVLKVARTSTAVKNMVKEWFAGKKFPINKWAFIIIVATIGTIIYAKMSGMI